MTSAITGAIAGLTATAPMTVSMEIMHRRLPHNERDPLPPRHLTTRLAHRVGLLSSLSEQDRRALTLLGHFGYGAAAGALFPALMRRSPLPPVATGIALGLAVWTASYAGWVPLTGLMPPPGRVPLRRNLLMIAAHVVWGAGTDMITQALDQAAADSLARSPQARVKPASRPRLPVGTMKPGGSRWSR